MLRRLWGSAEAEAAARSDRERRGVATALGGGGGRIELSSSNKVVTMGECDLRLRCSAGFSGGTDRLGRVGTLVVLLDRGAGCLNTLYIDSKVSLCAI